MSNRDSEPKYPNLNNIQRVLIVRLSSIGDVAHALPIAAALKMSYPHLAITWIVEEMSADIVLGNPFLSDVIVVPRNRWKKMGRLTSPAVWKEYFALLGQVRRGNFDLTLDFQGYAKSAFYVLAARAKHRLGWYRLRDGAGLVSKSVPKQPGSVHRVDLFLDLPKALGANTTDKQFGFHIPDKAKRNALQVLQQAGISESTEFVVINPCVGSPTRKWSVSSYAEVIDRLRLDHGLACVLVGSAKDGAVCADIVAKATDLALKRVDEQCMSLPVLADLSGKTDLKELAAVLKQCRFHICGDTGSAHIAAALGRPVIALYGPTDPLQAGPWNQCQNVISHRELCRPECGVRSCALATGLDSNGLPAVAKCLTEISPAEVMLKVSEVIDGRSKITGS